MRQKIDWNQIARELLLGRIITDVSYMSEDEAYEYGWEERPVVITLDNGLKLIPSRDDEGNGGGALFTTDEKNSCLPVIQ